MRKMYKNWGQRAVSWVLAAAIVCGLLPELTFAASAAHMQLIPGVTAITAGGIYDLASGKYTGASIIIPPGPSVTIYVNGATIIDNTLIGGAPFEIKEAGVLHLVLNDTLTVYGQNGTDGGAVSDSNRNQGTGGTKGYAGIRVPKSAALVISGSGKLSAYGGRAGNGGDGSTVTDPDGGGGGGSGAGAGIGGNGGYGIDGYFCYSPVVGSPNGEACGSIFVLDTVEIYAQGGGGGYAGIFESVGGGSGAGGYPAAGIGGGGAGGNGAIGWSGASGYSGGQGQGNSKPSHVHNGEGGAAGTGINGGGGYFSAGGSAGGYPGGPKGGGGGSAGAGGDIFKSATAVITAYNGNRYTTGVAFTPSAATPIYLQAGYANATTTVVDKQLLTGYGQGIGSGAASREISNGTFNDELRHYNLLQSTVNIGNSETYYNKREGVSGGGAESSRHMAGSLFGSALWTCVHLPSVCLKVGAG